MKFGRAEFRFAFREAPLPAPRTSAGEERLDVAGSASPVMKSGKRWRRSGPAKLVRRALLVLAALIIAAVAAIYLLFL